MYTYVYTWTIYREIHVLWLKLLLIAGVSRNDIENVVGENIPCVGAAKAKRCHSSWCIRCKDMFCIHIHCHSCWCIRIEWIRVNWMRIEWIRIETIRIEGMRIETIWVEWCSLICMIWYTLTIFWKPLRRNVFWERNRWFIAWPAGTLMIDPGSADHASFVSKSWAVIFTVVGSVIRGENRTCTKCSNIFSNLINLFEVRIFSNMVYL